VEDDLLGTREIEYDEFSRYRQRYPGRRKRNHTWKYKVESLARYTPERLAVAQGERQLNWDQFNRECNRLAHGLLQLGVKKEDRLAISGFNSIEWMECYFAASKIGAVPVNINPRFLADEVKYILEDSDAVVCFVEDGHVDPVVTAWQEVPKLENVIVYGVGRRAGEIPDSTLCYDDIKSPDTSNPEVKVFNDDFSFLMYTGGTTGYPKGTVWDGEQRVRGLEVLMLSGLVPEIDRLFELPEKALRGALSVFTGSERALDILTWLLSRGVMRNKFVSRSVRELMFWGLRAMLGRPRALKLISLLQKESIRMVPASPLFHGAAYEASFSFIAAVGGATVFLPTPHPFSPRELWETVEKYQAQAALIVGDAFAIPMLAELDRAEQEGQAYNADSLWVMLSSGVRWSAHIKRELLDHIPHMVVQDLMGASESSAAFAEVSLSSDEDFKLAGARIPELSSGLSRHELFPVRVVNPQTGKDVVAGSEEIGEFVYGGWMTLGYWKCPEKTADDFRVVDGKRWFFIGDEGTLDASGKFNLIGRGGNYLINTGGEKVYSEEVEGIVKSHPTVLDAAVVGTPDVRWGEAVTALVELKQGETVTAEELIEYCRARMADYKRPHHVFFVEKVPRSAAGKVDRSAALDLISSEKKRG
jgi:fatty-acyl-CoA synthase